MAIIKNYIKLPIGELIPYENNPRFNDDAVADVIESIKQCGELDPIEVDENNIILSGHTRLKAYQQLGYSEVSVLRISGLSEEQKRKYRLLTNKTGEKAQWDFDKLELELEGLDFDGFDFGFDVFSIDSIEAVSGYDSSNDDREYFNKTFCFPLEKKKKITNYLKKHYDEVVNRIISEAEGEA